MKTMVLNGKEYKIEIAEYFYSEEVCLLNPNKLFIYGDNTCRYGKAGQAQIRDRENSIGIATKFNPGMNNEDFFNDLKLEKCTNIMIQDAKKIVLCLSNPQRNFDTLVFPVNGFGTGLSMLPEKAPEAYKNLCTLLYQTFGVMTDPKTKRLYT